MWPLILFFNKVAPRWPRGLTVVWGSWVLNSSLVDTPSFPFQSTQTRSHCFFFYTAVHECIIEMKPLLDLGWRNLFRCLTDRLSVLPLTAIVQWLVWRNSLRCEQRHAISATAVRSPCGYRFWETQGLMTCCSGSRGYKTWRNFCLFGNVIMILQSELEVRQFAQTKCTAVLVFSSTFFFVICKA